MPRETSPEQRFLQGSIEPHAKMLSAPEPTQLLYKILRAEDLVRSMTASYLHFNRVDRYVDFPGADANDSDQLPNDLPGNKASTFAKAPDFSLADYYARARARTYACCFSLDNSDHIWREYAQSNANGKVALVFEFGKLRARLNNTLRPDRCGLLAEGKPCLQIFSVNFGIVEYVNRKTHQENQETFPNPVRYAYLKDSNYAAERELRVSLSALGVGQFVLSDGTPLPFPDSLQVDFDFRAAFADGTIKEILVEPSTNRKFLQTELEKIGVVPAGNGLTDRSP